MGTLPRFGVPLTDIRQGGGTLRQPSTSPGPETTSAYGGILLAGPPGSGKRTVTFALASLRLSYAPFPALTVARQPSIHAAPTTQRYLEELRAWAQIFHEYTAEGATYAYDRERLSKLRTQGRIPVACVDDVDALPAFEREDVDWLRILLWCPREEAERRLTRARYATEEQRASGRSSMRRWDRSSKGLLRAGLQFTLTLRSDHMGAVQLAQIVHLAAQSEAPVAETTPGSGVASAAATPADR